MAEPQLTSHARHNQAAWDAQADQYQDRHGAQLEASGGDAWGLWQRPESELGVLGEVSGRDVLELGCGAAQWSIALHRRDARVTGLDVSASQLSHARRLMGAAGVDFPLVHASAESTPFADAAFDIVFCDWGAMTFCDPHLTVPEAARVLRPGGLLAFCTGTPIADLAWPLESDHPGDRLLYDYWELHELREPGEPVAFQLPYGEWIALFGRCGLAVESLLELRPPADAASSYRTDADREWARRWPMEHIWRARRTSVGLDHVSVAAPPGCEIEARWFFGQLLGLVEIQKPAALSARGGVWFSLGAQQVHVGVEEPFSPATKAHTALRVAPGALDGLAERLSAAGVKVDWDDALPGERHFYSTDPWGNRIELLAGA